MSSISTIATYLSDVADAIREQTGGTEGILLSDMADEISSLDAGLWMSIVDRTYSGGLSSDTLTYVSGYAFYLCTKLTSVDFPACTRVEMYGLCATYMDSANLPACVTLDDYALSGSYVDTIDLSSCVTVGPYALSHCSFSTLDLPACTSLGTYALYQCTHLETLILRSDTVCTNTSTGLLAFTPIAEGNGYIYVPSDLLEEYQEATNWTTYADQFRAIEDYPDICGTD